MPFPALSVIMAVYNGEPHLAEAIQSILNQTCKDFEFIVINDGSTDGSGAIINLFGEKDNRIVVVHQENMGLARSLNTGIRLAKGDYIARQDADDVSFPGRLEKQMTFLKHHRDVVLCGAWFEEVNEGGGRKIRRYPLEDRVLRRNLKYINQFCHPSVVFEKQAFLRAGAYDERFCTGQDFELWIRMAEQGAIANIPEICVKKRIGFDTTISWKKRKMKLLLWRQMFEKHFKRDIKEVNPLKFIRYYLPLLAYGYLPVGVLKLVRRARYR